MKYYISTFIAFAILIISGCAVIDPPSKLTQWRESRPYRPIIVQNIDDLPQN